MAGGPRSRGPARRENLAVWPGHRCLSWRFEATPDPAPRRLPIRDADSFLSVKERAADAWPSSDRYSCDALPDTHAGLILAGMLGGIRDMPPSPATLVRAETSWRIESDPIDADTRSDSNWPAVRHSILVHDSFIAGTAGGVPFPPSGHLPARPLIR